MTAATYVGLFVAEGTSDEPLAQIIEGLFLDRGHAVRLSAPPYDFMRGVQKDVASKVAAAIKLQGGGATDLVVVHRDADRAGYDARLAEIEAAASNAAKGTRLIPVIPIRMTEAWLLLDEQAIRLVAGKPSGRAPLDLPTISGIERLADPKKRLRECLAQASETTGRRREAFNSDASFSEHRRRLLERLNRRGTVTKLTGWRNLITAVDQVAAEWAGRS